MLSLPSRERGLKFPVVYRYLLTAVVAPFAGAWIEIDHTAAVIHVLRVAPFAGAWIEIPEMLNRCATGLVAPFAGAWIEIPVIVTAV